MPEKTYIITESIRQGIAAYLSGQPWREVNQLMAALGTLKEIESGKKDKAALASKDD